MSRRLYLLKKIPNIDNVRRSIDDKNHVERHTFNSRKYNNCCAEFHPKHYICAKRCSKTKEAEQKVIDRKIALGVYKWVED